MDSDDEAQLAQEEKNIDRLFRGLPALRLYEDEEREAKMVVYRMRFRYWREIDGRNNADDHDDISRFAHYDLTSFYRVSRFLESFIRFHGGSLDLSGRSERRYSSLKKRIIAFLQDVELIQRHTTRHERRIPTSHRTLVCYDVEPAHILEDFEGKYRLSNVRAFLDELFVDADRCRALLQAETAPILQQKYLTNLPPELIHRIMDVSEVREARLLGATCSEFHEISAAYAFQTRSLVLSKPFPFLPGDDTNANAMHYRERFQSELDFLLSRADIMQRIRSLVISSFWDDDSLERADLAPGSPAHEDFFAPVKRGILRVLNGTNNVLQLHLGQLVITRSIISAMTSMHALSTLTLGGCRLGFHLRSLSRAPQLPQVVNATFTLFFPAHYDSLHVLHILPNVRKLTLKGMGSRNDRWAIPEFVILLCNPFRTVQRLFISGYADTDEDILMLAAWIANASRDTGQRLPLTHFKLEVRRGIRQHALMTLLSALRGAPLTALSLVGLSFVGEELFENLASAFPDLDALTLIHRQNDLQQRTRPSVWPGTTWEYAARLAGFANLRYFGWNFDIRPVSVDVMCNLPLAEKNDKEAGSLFSEPVDDTSDWQSLARLFLVYCPMLERLLFISDSTSQLECIISKDQSGKITIDAQTYTYVYQDYYKEVNPHSDV